MSSDIPQGLDSSEFGRRKTTYCDCPSCNYRGALAVTRTGEKTLFHCHAGCSQENLLKAIREQEPHALKSSGRALSRAVSTLDLARWLWRRSVPAQGTPVESYLKRRGIDAVPASLRYLPRHIHKPTHGYWRAMLASVVDAAGELRAVHRTYLKEDGSAKAPLRPPRMTLGKVRGYACHLGTASEELAVAEGIETALSFQILYGFPTWAALSAGGMRTLVLPPLPVAKVVTVAADADRPGLAAAEYAAARWREEGRQVRILPPPRPGMDFNDVLMKARLGCLRP